MTALTKKQRSLIAIQCWKDSKVLQKRLVDPERRKFYGLKKLASGKKAGKKASKSIRKSRK